MNILLFSGSLRTDSFNRKLVSVAQAIVSSDAKNQCVVADLKALALPVYDGDIEAAGIPAGVQQLGAMIAAADAVVISSPEYNHSIAGSLKNALDWVSRLKPSPWDNKPVLLLGASPGGFGAIRGLDHARQSFCAVGCMLYSQTFALPKAHEAFDVNGALKDKKTQERLAELLGDYLDYASRLKDRPQ